MTAHVVARADELQPGARKRVVVDGRAIAIFNLKGQYVAISDTCPHRGASLSGGVLTGLVTSKEPGDYTLTRDGEFIRCPWHAWEFDLKTGRSHCDPARVRAMCFPVTLVPGTQVAEGPYALERFPVVVDGEYLVIEV